MDRSVTDAVDVVDEDGVYHVYPRDERLPTSSTVVTALAAVTETEPTEFTELAAVVDPDALDRMFDVAGCDGVTAARFEYGGYEVTVHSSDHVSLDPN